MKIERHNVKKYIYSGNLSIIKITEIYIECENKLWELQEELRWFISPSIEALHNKKVVVPRQQYTSA